MNFLPKTHHSCSWQMMSDNPTLMEIDLIVTFALTSAPLLAHGREAFDCAHRHIISQCKGMHPLIQLMESNPQLLGPIRSDLTYGVSECKQPSYRPPKQHQSNHFDFCLISVYTYYINDIRFNSDFFSRLWCSFS